MSRKKKRTSDVTAFPLCHSTVDITSFARARRQLLSTVAHTSRGTRNARRNKSPGALFSLLVYDVSRNNDDIAKPWTRVSRFSMAPRCLFALNERRNCREASPMLERRLFYPLLPLIHFPCSSILPASPTIATTAGLRTLTVDIKGDREVLSRPRDHSAEGLNGLIEFDQVLTRVIAVEMIGAFREINVIFNTHAIISKKALSESYISPIL